MHPQGFSTDSSGTRSEFLRLLADHDAPPAFVARAQRVEGVWQAHLKQWSRDRNEMLDLCHLRLGQLAAIIDHRFEQLVPLLREQDLAAALADLHADWNPTLRLQPSPSTSLRKRRSALASVARTFSRFNGRWQAYLEQVDLSSVNWERHEYNEYYLVEKAAAFGSERVAALGFEPLLDRTPEDIVTALPYLPVAELA